MSCDEEALTAYLDGELKGEARAALEAHLKTCGSCPAVLSKLKAGSAAFREHGSVTTPPGLAEAVLGRPAQTAGRERRWAPAAVLASLTLAVFAGGKLLKPQISGIFNQTMGMISGAASTVGAGDGGVGSVSIPPASGLWGWLLLVALAGLATALWKWKARGREPRRWVPALVLATLLVVVLVGGMMFRPQIAGILMQIQGAISGAASTVGSGG